MVAARKGLVELNRGWEARAARAARGAAREVGVRRVLEEEEEAEEELRRPTRTMSGPAGGTGQGEYDTLGSRKTCDNCKITHKAGKTLRKQSFQLRPISRRLFRKEICGAPLRI